MLDRIFQYMTRGWDSENIHPLIKILPPFVYELLIYIVVISVILDQLFL